MPFKIYTFKDDGELVEDTLIEDASPIELADDTFTDETPPQTPAVLPITVNEKIVPVENIEEDDFNEDQVPEVKETEEVELDNDEEEAWQKEMERLRSYNQWAGLLHLIQGTGLLIYSVTDPTAIDFTMPVTSIFTNWDKGYPVQKRAVLFRYNFVAAASLFALMSAAAHFLVLKYWEKYEKDLKKGMNRFRWIEYAFSSSLVLILLMACWAHYEWVELLGVFVINAMMCLFGDLHEVLNSGRKPCDVNWQAFHYGGLCGMVPWGVTWGLVIASPFRDEYPWYAWAYLFTYQAAFFSFPFVMYGQYRQLWVYNDALYPLLKNGGYLAGERHYQILSLVSKSILVWLVAHTVFTQAAEIYDQLGSDY